MSTSQLTPPRSSRRNAALIGAAPFAVFGLMSLAGKLVPDQAALDLFWIFGLALLVALAVAGALRFPGWTPSISGWVAIQAWWWEGHPTVGYDGLWRTVSPEAFVGWRSWVPVLVVGVIALVLARETDPVRRVLRATWRDPSWLALGAYTFFAWASLVYDENHNRYLPVLLTASTVVLTAGAWLGLRGDTLTRRLFGLALGLVGQLVISAIDRATWDWYAYSGVARPAVSFAVAWASEAAVVALVFGVVFGPALGLAVVRAWLDRRQVVGPGGA